MDELRMLESKLRDEFSSKVEGTFIYDLHQLGVFNVLRFKNLLADTEKLANHYRLAGKSDSYLEVAKGGLFVFQHTLFLISCHFMPDDVYRILNYEEDLSSEVVSDFYYEIRTISALLMH